MVPLLLCHYGSYNVAFAVEGLTRKRKKNSLEHLSSSLRLTYKKVEQVWKQQKKTSPIAVPRHPVKNNRKRDPTELRIWGKNQRVKKLPSQRAVENHTPAPKKRRRYNKSQAGDQAEP
jgi:hypothetical protein